MLGKGTLLYRINPVKSPAGFQIRSVQPLQDSNQIGSTITRFRSDRFNHCCTLIPTFKPFTTLTLDFVNVLAGNPMCCVVKVVTNGSIIQEPLPMDIVTVPSSILPHKANREVKGAVLKRRDICFPYVAVNVTTMFIRAVCMTSFF